MDCKKWVLHPLFIAVALIVQAPYAATNAVQEPCSENALGMEDGRIPNENITASSKKYFSSIQVSIGRLRKPNGWCSAGSSPSFGYLQITLSTIFHICAIATQGHSTSNFMLFVAQYKLELSTAEGLWEFYKDDNNQIIILEGNVRDHHHDVEVNILQDGVMAKQVRIVIVSIFSQPCLRAEIYGKEASPDATLVPKDIQVINTTYNYVDIKWKTRPSYFFYGVPKGYIVMIQKLGNESDDGTLVFTSCHSEGIIITELEEYTTFCVYVASFTEHGKGNSTPCIVAVTGERPRVDFTAVNESSTSIRLSWDPNIPLPNFDASEAKIKIDYHLGTEENNTKSVLICVDSSPYLFSNLTVFTNYCYEVASFHKDQIDTKLPNKKCVFTDEEPPLGPPLNISARNESSTSINVTFQPIEEELRNGIILGYRISYMKNASTHSARKRRSLPEIEIVLLGENNITWVLEGLEKFSNYCMQIVGFNSKGDGNVSDSLCVMTDEDVPSLPPIITYGNNISSTSLTVIWSQIPQQFIHGILLGYAVTYRLNTEPDSASISIDFSPKEFNANITELLKYTEYCIRIAGKTRIGTGNWSDCYNISTDEDVPISPPIDVTAIEGSVLHTVNITWSPPPEPDINGILTGYKIVINSTLENGTKLNREFMTCYNHINLTGIDKRARNLICVAASTRKGLGPFSECIEYGVICQCPEYLQVVTSPSTLDEHQGEGSLQDLIETLIIESCGFCEHYEPDSKTKINRTIVADDADMSFPIVKYLHKIPPATGERSFVTVLQVPGLIVLKRKEETESGYYEKVMGSSVFDSWPIFAIFGAMTLAAGMVIWVLDVNANPEEFPPIFYKGAGEGLWWAFITMTTLGYGDRTPKSDLAKAFAMAWFLVGLVLFGLFAGAVTSALTVSVAKGGPSAAAAEKVSTISTLRNSPEKYVVVSKLSNKFKMGTEFDTIEELFGALKAKRTDAILVDMYVQMKRKDLFNGTNDLEVVEILDKEMAHGIELRGVAVPLAKQIEEYIKANNVQTKFLEESHEGEDEEEHEEHAVVEEESSLVFFEPGSPFFSATLTYGAITLLGCICLGIIYEVYRRKVRKNVQTGRYCQDEEEMRKMVEEFYQDFTRTYKALRKKSKLLIKLTKKGNQEGFEKGNEKLIELKKKGNEKSYSSVNKGDNAVLW